MRRAAIVTAALLLTLTGCERVFTTSPFSFLQRDPASYSAAQLEVFARDALASGDQAAMAEAFALLSDSSDPATQLLAVELGLGAAGIDSAVTALIAGLSDEATDSYDDLDAALASFSDAEIDILIETGAILSGIDESAGPTADQYALAALGLVVAAADAAGGAGNLPTVAADSEAQGYLDDAGSLVDAGSLLDEWGSTGVFTPLEELVA
jgi:hypothetical protein